MPRSMIIDIGIDANDGKDDGEPPRVREAVSQIGARRRDPAPVCASRHHDVQADGDATSGQGNNPYRQADEDLLGPRDRWHVDLLCDRQESDLRQVSDLSPKISGAVRRTYHRNGEHGEVGSLDRDLRSPAVYRA